MARVARRSGRRTDYTWTNFGDIALGQDLGVVAQLGPSKFLFNLTSTIVRLRGKVGVTLDTGGVDENAIILCGLFLAVDDLNTAPEIFTGTADEASWIWQGALYVSSGSEAAVNTNFLSDSIEIDSKAMRKVKSNRSLFFIHEAPAALVTDQAGTYDISYYVHILGGA